MARRKKKQPKKAQHEYTFVYADIETFSPSTDPQFWIGGLKINGKYYAYDNFKDFWDKMTEYEKGKRRVVVFHNSEYDMSILTYHATRELDYQENPGSNGYTKAIYTGQYHEIYTNNNQTPIFVVDSKNLMPGALARYGEMLNFEKGETPIANEYRKPLDSDYKYLKRDVDILEMAFKGLNHEQSVEKGLLTISSLSQWSIKDIHSQMTGKTYRRNGLKRKHGGKTLKDEKPLPTCVREQIEHDCEAFRIRETVYHRETRKPRYSVSDEVVEQYALKCRRYWLSRFEEDVENFKEMQKAAIKELMKRDKKQPYDNDVVTEYFELPLPDGEAPDGKYLADRHNIARILEFTNKQIAPSMRGGMTYVNPEYVGQKVKHGGVLDVNSLYPTVLMKYGIPTTFVGSTVDVAPDNDKFYIAQVTRLKARIHDGKHPFLKRSTTFTNDKVYEPYIDWTAKERDGRLNTVLCSVDILWLYENYDVEEIEFGRVYYFEEDESYTKSVREHIKYWKEKKEQATNKTDRQYAKLMLNTIWGRWGMFEKEVDDAGFKIDIGDKDTNYVSAIFTTAYARVYLNKMMNWFSEDLLYTDTDSVHFLFGNKVKDDKDLKNKLEKVLDAKVFGMWDFEKEFEEAKYMKAKTYAMRLKGSDKIKTVTAGRQLPTMNSLDDFHFGAEYIVKENKKDKHGRILIYQSTYTLKER